MLGKLSPSIIPSGIHLLYIRALMLGEVGLLQQAGLWHNRFMKVELQYPVKCNGRNPPNTLCSCNGQDLGVFIVGM